VLWIELSSKCPFDCVFCSRRLRHGAGVHMDMGLFSRIIADLDAPEIIRLNYSGESTHHPDLIEAIELASSTGASTELVTALASLPDRLIEPLAASGLDRLTVSLHTLDPEQYRSIYRHGSVDAVRGKLSALVEARSRAGRSGPAIDIATVAMRRNLAQLPRIADFARQAGATSLAIHPVIRRDPIAETFSEELDDGRLRTDFIAALNAMIEAIRRLHPDLPLAVSSPEVQGEGCLGARPQAVPGSLPPGARIHTCEQNPWETAHILADGSVVACEARDAVVMGKIASDPSVPGLSQVWSGPAYSAFRAAYRTGAVPECRQCPYKTAYRPSDPMSAIDASEGMHAQLLYGWHPADGSGLLWAKRTAALELARGARARLLHVEGVIPAHAGRVRIECGDIACGEVGNAGSEPQWIAVDLPLEDRAAGMVPLVFAAERGVVPARRGSGADIRELGFGLRFIEMR
jgi:MoaA/NifB/PqqE/SkfB family radical SAM enzyme